jgi:predicted TIM-barrel fold metal-dependent hydrolase
MSASRIISADSHVMEPGNLWVERMDARFRERAPRVVPNPEAPGFVFTAEGRYLIPAVGADSVGTGDESIAEKLERDTESDLRSTTGWDATERIEAQDKDGVEAEVIYTTLGMSLFGLRDGELQREAFRAYNDWLFECCSENLDRFIPIALISLEDVDLAVKDIQSAAHKGFRGAMITASTAPDRSFGSRDYDPFWHAASEAGMPISLHNTAGRANDASMLERVGLTAFAGRGDGELSLLEYAANLIYEVPRSLITIIFSGVLERFPELQVVSTENDVGWMPYFLQKLDHVFEKFGQLSDEPLSMKPSEYARRQIFATFQDDPIGASNLQYFGASNYMWASDYPHLDSTWPNSRQVIEKNFADVPTENVTKIVYENAARLYRLG